MARKNYFELLSLSFDPPESNQRRIELQLESWKSHLESALGGETDDLKRRAMQAELDLYPDIQKTFADKKSRNAEARALKDERIGQLEQIIELCRCGQTGTPEVSSVQMRDAQLRLGLSASTVQKSYRDKGFQVRPPRRAVQLHDFFLSAVIAQTIRQHLAQLRALDSVEYPWCKQVNDLFDLACYYSGGTQAQCAAYHRKKTDDLRSIMAAAAARLASDISEQGALLAGLCSAGSAQVFDSEDDRRKYENTLAQEQLHPFFDLLKTVPESFKRDPCFADACIDTIRRVFSDYELALSLYNLEAGISADPYEPVPPMVHVSCVSCGAPAVFRTRSEAEKARCAACGTPLYIECPQCGSRVPAAASRCSCGFRISEMRFFDEYCQAALAALKRADLAEAERRMSCAEAAWPGNPHLAALKKQVQTESRKYRAPLQKLEDLISERRFFAAREALDQLHRTLPQLDLTRQRTRIDSALQRADALMPGPGLSNAEKVVRYSQILHLVEDYETARQLLAAIPPEPPRALRADVNEKAPYACTLHWTGAGEAGIVYTVVRKAGSAPAHPADGQVLKAGLTGCSFTDSTLLPGARCCYAVFACRGAGASAPVCCTVDFLAELDPDKLHVDSSRICQFRWELPPNCTGVRVLRCTGGIPAAAPGGSTQLLAAQAGTGFSDPGVSVGGHYGYRLQCIYSGPSGRRYSAGQVLSLTPDVPPVALRSPSVTASGRNATVSWAPQNTSQYVMVREAPAQSIRHLVGQVLPMGQINRVLGNSRTLAGAGDSEGKCQFTLPLNTTTRIALVTSRGSQGMICLDDQVSSLEPCTLDKTRTGMNGTTLTVFLTRLPPCLEKLHYAAAPKTGPSAPWATVRQAEAGQLRSISAAEYSSDGMLAIPEPPQAALYVTVIGEYRMPDGSVLFSEPSRLKVNNAPKEEIHYGMHWSCGLLGKRRARGASLTVRSRSDTLPALRLVYTSDGHIPLSANEPGIVTLLDLPDCSIEDQNSSLLPAGVRLALEEDGSEKHLTLQYDFNDAIWAGLPAGAALRMMFSNTADAQSCSLHPLDAKQLFIPG